MNFQNGQRSIDYLAVHWPGTSGQVANDQMPSPNLSYIVPTLFSIAILTLIFSGVFFVHAQQGKSEGGQRKALIIMAGSAIYILGSVVFMVFRK